MSPIVRFRLSDGRLATVPAGGLLGRLATAALRIEDARVSEAHALVSLRNGRLHLLSLRGALAVDGASCESVVLVRGLRVQLAPGIELAVEDLELPESVLAIELDGVLQPLTGEVWSVIEVQAPTGTRVAVPRFEEPALARIWVSGPGWRIVVEGERPRELVDGLTLQVGGGVLVGRTIALGALDAAPTAWRGRLHPPLRLVVSFAETRIEVEGRPPVHLHGHSARIFAELVDYPESVPWALVARALWPEERDEGRLRVNWDRNVRLLRTRLREGGVREDLACPDGHGNIGIRLLAGDVLERGG